MVASWIIDGGQLGKQRPESAPMTPRADHDSSEEDIVDCGWPNAQEYVEGYWEYSEDFYVFGLQPVAHARVHPAGCSRRQWLQDWFSTSKDFLIDG